MNLQEGTALLQELMREFDEVGLALALDLKTCCFCGRSSYKPFEPREGLLSKGLTGSFKGLGMIESRLRVVVIMII